MKTQDNFLKEKEAYLKRYEKEKPDEIIFVSSAGDLPLTNLQFHIAMKLLYRYGAYGCTINGKKILYKLT